MPDISKWATNGPTIESVIVEETRICADIRCMDQHTVQVEGAAYDQGELDRVFSADGWRVAPHIGGHFCPRHARRPSA